MNKGKHADLTRKIIGAFFQVYNMMGYGFSERVYENSLVVELKKLGLKVQQQQEIIVYYKGVKVGEYFTDLMVDDTVILELKAVRKLSEDHEAQ